MVSSLSTRLQRAYEAAGRPLPQFVEDDVLDFQITEAIMARAGEEKIKQQKDEERRRFRKSHREMRESAS